MPWLDFWSEPVSVPRWTLYLLLAGALTGTYLMIF